MLFVWVQWVDCVHCVYVHHIAFYVFIQCLPEKQPDRMMKRSVNAL